MGELPIAPVKRLLKSAGATRISDEAAIRLAEVLEEIGENITHDSLKYTRHGNRKTIRGNDIRLAANE